MNTATVTFIGSGDAFGSGGRLQTCILVDAPRIRFTLDFGATSLVGLERQGIELNSIDALLLTHLHGDHCGGVPFFLIASHLSAKRENPLTILGPSDTEAHLKRIQGALFPGSQAIDYRFPLEYREIRPGSAAELGGLTVSAVAARHAPDANPQALRVQIGDKAIAYTGDGEFTEDLAQFVAGVDLLIAECYAFDKPIRAHCNYTDISRFDAKRIVLTHMSSEMLAQVDRIPEECASDGYSITV